MIKSIKFGTIDNEDISLYTLSNTHGDILNLTNYGARIQSMVIDNTDVMLGFDTLAEYIEDKRHHGAIVGRFAGRMKDAEYTLNGKTVSVDKNAENYQLNGGSEPFDKKVWSVHQINESENFIEFKYISPKGDGGYPCELIAYVKYQLTEQREVKISTKGTTADISPCNMTFHGYFNLNGHGDISNNILQIDSQSYVEINDKKLPTGKMLPTLNAHTDATKPIKLSEFYDKFVDQDVDVVYSLIDTNSNNSMKECASLISHESNLKLTVKSNAKAFVLYNAARMPEIIGKNKQAFNAREAICFEPQYFPDSLSIENFESALATKDKPWEMDIIYHFEKI